MDTITKTQVLGKKIHIIAESVYYCQHKVQLSNKVVLQFIHSAFHDDKGGVSEFFHVFKSCIGP